MEDLLKVGVITTTHGIRGEVKVYPTTDADRFLDLEYVLLDTGREKRKLEIENVKYFKNLVILKFKGIDNINDIERYKRCPLLVERKDAVELEEDEYYKYLEIAKKTFSGTLGANLSQVALQAALLFNAIYAQKVWSSGEANNEGGAA